MLIYGTVHQEKVNISCLGSDTHPAVHLQLFPSADNSPCSPQSKVWETGCNPEGGFEVPVGAGDDIGVEITPIHSLEAIFNDAGGIHMVWGSHNEVSGLK